LLILFVAIHIPRSLWLELDRAMSDLLPLVAAALQDNVAVEAAKEISALRKEREDAHKVEVLRAKNNGNDEDEDDPVVVYASAPFESGEYGANTNLWQVTLQNADGDGTTCKLADLRDCHICVGGGFPVASLDDHLANSAPLEGWLQNINAPHRNPSRVPDEGSEVESPDDGVCGVSICFCPHATWLMMWIRGWPREDWEAKIQADDLNPDEIIGYLVDEVAVRYPDAAVQFKDVSFVAKSIHGALKRLLPAEQNAEVRADRDERIASENPGWVELITFVSLEMRNRGIDAGPELFVPQLQAVMSFVLASGLTERGANDEAISEVVRIAVGHIEQGGLESLQLAITEAHEEGEEGAQEEEGGEAGEEGI